MFDLTATSGTPDTQVVIHSKLDAKAFTRVKDGFSPLAQMSQKTTLPAAASFVENVFCSFYRSVPTLAPEEHLSGVQRIQRGMIEGMMQTGEYKRVRGSGTAGQSFPSGLATAAVTERMIESLDRETARKLQRLQQAEQQAQQLEQQAQQLAQLAGMQPDGQDAQDMQAQATQNQTNAQSAKQRAEQLAQELDGQAQEIADAARVAARKGLEDAEQQIDDMNEAVRAFCVGAGSQPGREQLLLNLDEKMQLAALLIQNPKLARIAELAGHLIDVALQMQKQKFLYPPTQITGIELGNNIQRIVPSEFIFLARPELRGYFAKQYTEKALVQRKMIGQRTLGRGPIQFALDGSGSMGLPFDATDLRVFNKKTGQYEVPTKEEYAKAVVIALLFIAQRQQRDLIVMHFSGSGKMKQYTFLHKQYTHRDVLECMAFFFGGGTRYSAWMQQSLVNARDAKFAKSTLIVLSDGDSPLLEQEVSEYNTQRQKVGLDAIGIMVATPQELASSHGDEKLACVTDTVIPVTDLGSLKKAEEAMFSI